MTTQNPYLATLALLETAGGTKTIKGPNSEDSYNLFNIKLSPAERARGRKGFVAHDKAEGSRDPYRVYSSYEESEADLLGLLQRKYPEAHATLQKPWSEETAREFAEGLKRRGYATDPQYVEKFTATSRRVTGPAEAPAMRPTASAAKTLFAMPTVAEWVGTVKEKPGAMAQGDEAQANRTELAEQRTPLVKLGAAMRNASTGRIVNIINEMRADFDNEADPEFRVAPDMVKDVQRQDDLDELLTARSKAEFEFFRSRQLEQDERTKLIMQDGTWSGIGYALAGEIADPTNWLGAFGAAKAVGRTLLAGKEVTTGRAVAGAVTENLIAGTALEAALQAGEGRPDLGNLFLAATADLSLGLAGGAIGARAALLERASIATAEREIAALRAASDDLGPSATPEAIRALAGRKLAGEVEAPLQEAVRPLRSERMLMDRPDELGEEAANGAALQPATADLDLRTKNAVSIMDLEDAFGTQIATEFESSAVQQARVAAAASGKWDGMVTTLTGGEYKTANELLELPSGVTVTKAVAEDVSLTPGVKTLKALAEEYLPNSRVVFGPGTDSPTAHGQVASFGKTHVIGVKPAPGKPTQVFHTTVHELGHAIYHEAIAKAPLDLVERIKADWLQWVEQAKKGAPEAIEGRFAITSPNADLTQLKTNRYNLSLDEWMAEQYVKHVEARFVSGDFGKVDKSIAKMVVDAIKQLVAFFGKAKARGLIGVSEAADEFYTAVLDKTLKGGAELKRMVDAGPAVAASKPADEVAAVMTDPVAVKYGLDLLPVKTAAERANVKAMLNLAKKADAWAEKNPKDAEWDKRADNLIDNSLFSAASTGLRLLKSNNNIARFVATELLEDASGVAGKKQSTAAISKYLMQRAFLGNSINELQSSYQLWAKSNGINVLKDQISGGKGWELFNRQIADEIEGRRLGAAPTTDAAVKKAADSLEAAYERIRKGQVDAKTLGYQALWDNSKGYMPHKLSPSKWLNLSINQRRAVQEALRDQFINVEGWDISFSDNLAAKYMQIVGDRATKGHTSHIGGGDSGSAQIVEDALLAMGMSKDEVRANMQRFNRGAAKWTKQRLNLDLTKSYEVDGQSFKLMDVFETDQLALLRAQAGRASGEVALARHGVYGKPGLTLMREAMTQGNPGTRADVAELEAFDQIAAEFMDEPFGTAGPKWLENARVLNSVVRLGGIVFNQFGEFINGVAHLGVVRTLAGVAGMKRLRTEVKALSRGEQVDNSLLSSIERLGGAEFGTDAYKIVLPFDMPDHAYQTYGADTVTAFDKLVRGAGYLQGKLSLWRTVHSVQQRAMAEQIVAKIARYVRDGGEDVSLDQFGITPAMRQAIKADEVAKWDASGSLLEFDVSKIADPDLREEVIHAVHRGVNQIIQGTFIGEQGKWAHDGYLKLLTQFRTFSLTAMEKQWGRQRNSRGVGQALGILLGSMMAAVPVYVARVYVASIGREDQEEYIEQRLAPELIARQTLNYVALGGLAGDFLDIGAALAPDELGVKVTGGRAGTDTDFVGSIVAPSISLVDDAWKAMQNLDDPERLARVLPGSRLPYVLPAINALGD